MKTSQRGIDILEDLESFSGEAYNDEAGNATIGYGDLLHKGPVTEPEKTLRITVQDAEFSLTQNLKKYEDALNVSINETILPRVKQNQFDSLVLWTFNCGIGAMQRSSWLKALNRGQFKDVPRLMELYNKITGPDGELVVSHGLVNRRTKETMLFLE